MTDRIEADLIQALKSKDEIVLSSLRNLKAEIKNTEIEKQHTLSWEEVLEVVRRKVKQHKDSIESFTNGAREDLVAIEQRQMAVLVKYLPRQMAEDEVRNLVLQAVSDLSASQKDFGKVMKEVLSRAKGSTDGGTISKILKEELK